MASGASQPLASGASQCASVQHGDRNKCNLTSTLKVVSQIATQYKCSCQILSSKWACGQVGATVNMPVVVQ